MASEPIHVKERSHTRAYGTGIGNHVRVMAPRFGAAVSVGSKRSSASRLRARSFSIGI